MTFRTFVQAIAAFLLSALAPASAWGIDAFEQAFPDEEVQVENPGWTCSVRDSLEASPVSLVFSLSKESAADFQMTLRGRYELGFALGRADSEGLPSGSSGDFLTLRLRDRRQAGRERVVFQGVHVMNPCDSSAGRFREVAQDPGFEIECVPDRGFAAYFGDMKNECADYMDPVVRRMEIVRRGMATFDGGTGVHAPSIVAGDNGAAFRRSATTLEEFGSSVPAVRARTGEFAPSAN